jgi:hypothetical protein
MCAAKVCVYFPKTGKTELTKTISFVKGIAKLRNRGYNGNISSFSNFHGAPELFIAPGWQEAYHDFHW